MTDENNQEVQEETVRFSDDGPEYKVSDLSDEAVLILNKCKRHQEQKNRYIQEANLNVEQMDILIGYYRNPKLTPFCAPRYVAIVSISACLADLRFFRAASSAFWPSALIVPAASSFSKAAIAA